MPVNTQQFYLIFGERFFEPLKIKNCREDNAHSCCYFFFYLIVGCFLERETAHDGRLSRQIGQRIVECIPYTRRRRMSCEIGRGAASRASSLRRDFNPAIKSSTHVDYFIQFPKLPLLKRIHNYQRIRELVNLSSLPWQDPLGHLGMASCMCKISV